jgi:hypothetical protein
MVRPSLKRALSKQRNRFQLCLILGLFCLALPLSFATLRGSSESAARDQGPKPSSGCGPKRRSRDPFLAGKDGPWWFLVRS